MKIKLPRFMRPPPMFSHEQTLRRLKEVGFAPSTIYDIGAFHGAWTRDARKVFPSAGYFLFEANADNKPVLEASGEKHFLAVLSDTDGVQKNLYLPKQATATGVSLYREKTVHYSDDLVRIVPVTTRRLDVLAKENRLPPPDFIKLDVQGAELDVLAGAGDLLKNCTGLMAEMSVLAYNEAAPLLADVIAGIDRLGFRSVDISEIHQTASGSIFQMDMLFVNAVFYEKYRAAAGLT